MVWNLSPAHNSALHIIFQQTLEFMSSSKSHTPPISVESIHQSLAFENTIELLFVKACPQTCSIPISAFGSLPPLFPGKIV